jgi:probable HAF family extracellular repeat protein
MGYVCGLGGVLAAGSPAQAQCQYSVEIIQAENCGPPFGSFPPTFGRAISENGLVAGDRWQCNLIENDEAFYWSQKQGLVELVRPPGVLSLEGKGINSAGVMCGTIYPSTAFVQGYVWEAGAFTVLQSPPGGGHLEAFALNDAGMVTGYRDVDLKTRRAFIWSEGHFFDIEPSFGPTSIGLAISKSGAVVGWMGLAPHIDSHAFLWTDGEIVDLGVPRGWMSAYATAVNERNQVVGTARGPDPSGVGVMVHAFLWIDRVAIDLGTLPGTVLSHAADINSSGLVVGSCGNTVPIDRAFVWHAGAMTDLETLISRSSGILLSHATAVNDAGQIVCVGTFEHSLVSVILTPIDAPMADLTGDCTVDGNDLSTLLAAWGSTSPPADLNGDGAVNGADLGVLLLDWG